MAGLDASGNLQVTGIGLTPAGLLQITNAANTGTQTVSTLAVTATGAGTFTPNIAFGGASVGVTYTSHAGEYFKIGRLVVYSVIIQLSSKGSSTGNATITGLPFASDGFSWSAFAQVVGVASPAGLSTAQTIYVSLNGASSLGIFGQFVSPTAGLTTVATVTNVECTNTSSFFVTGSYVASS